ncbi:trigger factor [Nitrosovibrio sp. Nv17]|uniref:trigger factor n=1 Tax=Nitrosovibrio sp. Nv17 TaxID=1855339 RepID=UPI0009090F79|nr:trigger factor [Nitrosovibrio sp. Nv17]SFW27220.1 trigger factor [Nitrosovibrio sp. Nv17]
MQSNVEDLGALARRLNVSIPHEKIETEIENRLKRLARTAKVHGFRPGKVPLKIIAQQYGPQVRQEVVGDVLQQNFTEAIREQNLRVAGHPQFEPKPGADDASRFEFSATFEVYPEVVPGELNGVRIERPVVEVTESDIDRTLGILRKQQATYEAEDRPAARGDRITLDYRGTLDGVEFAGGKAENVSIVLGEGKLLADFEAPLEGMRAGDRKTFDVTFPADYHGKEVAGKTATFEVRLGGVEGIRLPEVDAGFARVLGVPDGNTDTMREEIRANLKREILKRTQAKIKERVMQALLDATAIQTPKVLVERELERLLQEARSDFESRGVSARDVPLPQDLFREQAQRRVSLGLILAEVVKANGLKARPEEVRAVVEDVAQSYEDPEEVIRWHYASPERLHEVESAVLEDNVVAWVLERVTVSDRPMTLDELMGRA